MSGTKGAQQRELLSNREARIAEMMRQDRSVIAIAAAVGLEPDYTGKVCKQIAAKFKINFNPENKRKQGENAVPPGLSDRTANFRRRAANALYLWGVRTKRHQLDVCSEIGMTRANQRAASKAHGPYDWRLSQLDRWCEAMDVPFEELILDLTFDAETATRMKACLKKG